MKQKRVKCTLEVSGEYLDYTYLDITETQFNFLLKVIKTMNIDLDHTSIKVANYEKYIK